jgi:hypothetical protein
MLLRAGSGCGIVTVSKAVGCTLVRIVDLPHRRSNVSRRGAFVCPSYDPLMADIPDALITLERAAEAERSKLAGLDDGEHEAQRVKWRRAAAAFQAEVTVYAARKDVGMSRHEFEQAVKRAAHHGEEDPAE